MDSRIIAFLHWRQGTTLSPLDPEELKAIPECVLGYTEAIETITWTKVDPKPGYWMIENYLSNRRLKQRSSQGTATLADADPAQANQSEKYSDSRDYYYHHKYGYATDGSATARSKTNEPTAITHADRDEYLPASFTRSQHSRSSEGNSTLELTLHHSTSAAPQTTPSYPAAQIPQRSAAKAHFYELQTKGIWQQGDALRVPLYQDRDRKIQQGTGLLRYVGLTAYSRWATDWDFSVNNGPVSRIEGINGPTDFIKALDNLGVTGPKGAWSSRVRVVRGGQDLGTVTEFKASNNVDASVRPKGS